jgi:hypothetical protein
VQRIKFKQFGSLAVPVFKYSFGIINWHQEELQKRDRKTRKLLTIDGQHHQKADIDHLYASRKQGRRGLMQLRSLHSRNYITGGTCRQQKKSTNSKQQCCRELDASRENYRDEQDK